MPAANLGGGYGERRLDKPLKRLYSSCQALCILGAAKQRPKEEGRDDRATVALGSAHQLADQQGFFVAPLKLLQWFSRSSIRAGLICKVACQRDLYRSFARLGVISHSECVACRGLP